MSQRCLSRCFGENNTKQQATLNKSSLLLKLELQNTQTLKLNCNGIFRKGIMRPSQGAWVGRHSVYKINANILIGLHHPLDDVANPEYKLLHFLLNSG